MTAARPEVVIIGGGVIGCATAYFLAHEGAAVTLLERGELASEASGAAAGMLAALSDEGGDRGLDFQQLCLDSLELYETLLAELQSTGIDLRYRDSGVLHLALSQANAANLRQRFDNQRDLAPENRWLEVASLLAEEPQATSKAIAGLLSPSEHYLDPQRLTRAFAKAAASLGAKIVTSVEATGFLRRDSRIAGVRTSERTYLADAVVLAGGPWTADMARGLGCFVPVRPVRGQMLSLRGPRTPLRHVIWGEHAYLVPREEGQTFVGASVEEVGFRKRNTQVALAELRRRAIELVPELARAEVVRTWAGLRPGTPDSLPIMGLLQGWQNAWVSTGHFRNGILLAPISGQLMARSVIEGSPVSQLAPFAPSRFTPD